MYALRFQNIEVKLRVGSTVLIWLSRHVYRARRGDRARQHDARNGISEGMKVNTRQSREAIQRSLPLPPFSMQSLIFLNAVPNLGVERLFGFSCAAAKLLIAASAMTLVYFPVSVPYRIPHLCAFGQVFVRFGTNNSVLVDRFLYGEGNLICFRQ